MKIAMVVIDANEVAGNTWRAHGYPSPSVHPAIQALIDALAKRPGITCHILYARSDLKNIESRQEGNVVYEGIPYGRFPLPGGAMVGRFIVLRRYLKKLKPDLVHGQGSERESALVAAFSDFPSVITLHGNFREIRKIFKAGFFSYYGIAAALETVALNRVKGLICISRYVKEITQSFTVPKFLIPNAVRDQFLNAIRPESKNIKHVCCMGTIDERKRTRFILEACIQLWKKGINFIFHIYGTPNQGMEYFNQLMSDLKPWAEKNLAIYEGFAEDPLKAILHADVMVSASCEESFGMNVLEAMAAGTPVIAPAVGGIQDIIISEETGLFYKANNVIECAAQIERLLTDPSLWSEISKKGRIRAQEYFSPDYVANKTILAYEEILSH